VAANRGLEPRKLSGLVRGEPDWIVSTALEKERNRRYNATCAAALAGCGQGLDTDKIDAMARGRLRRQALDWLRADMSAWDRLLGKEPDKVRQVMCRTSSTGWKIPISLACAGRKCSPCCPSPSGDPGRSSGTRSPTP
jgi:hypothetical protein